MSLIIRFISGIPGNTLVNDFSQKRGMFEQLAIITQFTPTHYIHY